MVQGPVASRRTILQGALLWRVLELSPFTGPSPRSAATCWEMYYFVFQEVPLFSKALYPCLVSEGIRNPLNSLPSSQMEFPETNRHIARYSERRIQICSVVRQHFSSIWNQFVSPRALRPKYITSFYGKLVTSDRETDRQNKIPTSVHLNSISPEFQHSHRTNRKINP